MDIRVEDASSHGRADIVLIEKDQVFVLELKVAEGASIDAKAEQVLQSIRQQGYAEKYRQEGRTIYLLAVVFDPAKRNLATIRVEQA